MSVRAYRLALAIFAGSLAGGVYAQPSSWDVTILMGGARAWGVGDGQQVGAMSAGFGGQAVLWPGSGGFVSLHSGFGDSAAYDTDGTQQVGLSGGGTTGVYHAVLWTGSAGSAVSLHPPGARSSHAVGIDAGQQVGVAEFGGVWRAGWWNGSAGSWVDLHPAGATGSEATGIHGQQQVGYAVVDGDRHASLWTGDAQSWVDLHPAGAFSSEAWGVHSGYQAGFANIGGVTRAVVWNGDAESWEDLAAPFPGAWTRTHAFDIWSDGETLYVVGFGVNRFAQEEALLWTRPIDLPCYADCDESGQLDFFDFLCFQNLFAASDPRADCDGSGDPDFFDFLCFQNVFAAGCP